MSPQSIRPLDRATVGIGPEHLLVVCAWCGTELHRPQRETLRTSHSICERCTDRVIEDNALRGATPDVG